MRWNNFCLVVLAGIDPRPFQYSIPMDWHLDDQISLMNMKLMMGKHQNHQIHDQYWSIALVWDLRIHTAGFDYGVSIPPVSDRKGKFSFDRLEYPRIPDDFDTKNSFELA